MSICIWRGLVDVSAIINYAMCQAAPRYIPCPSTAAAQVQLYGVHNYLAPQRICLFCRINFHRKLFPHEQQEIFEWMKKKKKKKVIINKPTVRV